MWGYIGRRLLHGALVLFLVSIVVFSLVRLLPGDAVLMQLDQAAALTKEDLARARQELGIDRPFLEQYRSWAGGCYAVIWGARSPVAARSPKNCCGG